MENFYFLGDVQQFIDHSVVLAVENGDVMIGLFEIFRQHATFSTFSNHQSIHCLSVRRWIGSVVVSRSFDYLLIVNKHLRSTDLNSFDLPEEFNLFIALSNFRTVENNR